MAEKAKRRWTAVAVKPPALSNKQWWAMSFIGVIFLLMALLQIISFSDFSNNFAALDTSTSNILPAVLIFLEIWAAVGFFKIRLSRLFRKVSNVAAGLVAGFWFYENIKAVAQGSSGDFIINGQRVRVVGNFFGRFLGQAPGWWTVLEATLFLILVIWALNIMQKGSGNV